MKNEIRLLELEGKNKNRNLQNKGVKMIMKKEPFVTKEQLQEIVKKYPTPFHLYDEKRDSC